jgi:hypothetical protein
MFKPTLLQQETIADMALGGMAPDRISTALGISPEAYAAWVCRLMAARALDTDAVERLYNPARPVAVQPPSPAPPRDPRILAERIFETAE